MVAAINTPVKNKGAVAPGSEITQDPSQQPNSNYSTLTYAIMVALVGCFKIHKNNLFVKADQLESNADEQNYWEDQIKTIKDPQINPGDSNSVLAQKNAECQENSSERADDEDVIMTLSNQAHVMCGESQQETNETQQCASMVSMTLKSFEATGAGIAQMDGRS